MPGFVKLQSVKFDTVLSKYNDLTVYKPELPGDDWVYFGPVATSTGVSEHTGLIAKAVAEDAVADIVDWEVVFSDTESEAFSTWRGIPSDPSKYVTIGHVFVEGTEKPTQEQTAGIKAIRKDLVAETQGQRKVWENKDPQLTIWDLVTLPIIYLSTGAFVTSHDQEVKNNIIHVLHFHIT